MKRSRGYDKSMLCLILDTKVSPIEQARAQASPLHRAKLIYIQLMHDLSAKAAALECI